jgi:hypothetical protein
MQAHFYAHARIHACTHTHTHTHTHAHTHTHTHTSTGNATSLFEWFLCQLNHITAVAWDECILPSKGLFRLNTVFWWFKVNISLARLTNLLFWKEGSRKWGIVWNSALQPGLLNNVEIKMEFRNRLTISQDGGDQMFVFNNNMYLSLLGGWWSYILWHFATECTKERKSHRDPGHTQLAYWQLFSRNFDLSIINWKLSLFSSGTETFYGDTEYICHLADTFIQSVQH